MNRLLVAILLLAGEAAGPGVALAASPRRIVYGGDSTAAPYESLDPAGRPQGFNVDLVRAMARKTGFEVTIRLGSWPEILQAFDAGEIDLVSMAYTDARALRYDMLAEIWTLRQGVFFPADRASHPERLDQLGAETIAVPEGLYMHDVLAALPESQRPLLRPVPGSAQQLELLRRGEVTAVAGNALILSRAAADGGLRGLREVPVKALSYQLAARKGRAAGFDWIESALEELHTSGEYTALVERHLTGDVAARRTWRDYLFFAAVVAGCLGLGLAGARAWNRSLRSQVQLRTDELKQSLSLLRSALESTADGMLVVDEAGRVSAYNERFVQMWRLPRALLEAREDGALLAHVVEQLIDPDRFLAGVRELYADPAREGNDILYFKDGRVFERYSLPQRLDGRTVGRVWSFRDVTARRNAETEQARLEDSVRRAETMAAMGSLVAGVAHEVRNPLFNISSTLDVFETRLPEAAEAGRTLDTLRRELRRLSSLMNDLLDYGRPPELRRQPGAVAEALREAVAFNESLATQAAVRVRLEANGDLHPVQMDRERLVQAFQNLIQNAVQHSPRGGEVIVRAQASPEGAPFVACSFRDHGPGFQPADLPRVFEPFFTRRRGGTGLGLALVQRIVDQHGGQVLAENHPDGGALLTVRLPMGERT